MKTSSQVVVEFQMMNGDTLTCSYELTCFFGRSGKCYEDLEPDYYEAGKPTYYIRDREVMFNDLPRGLAKIALDMYNDDNTNPLFHYKNQ